MPLSHVHCIVPFVCNWVIYLTQSALYVIELCTLHSTFCVWLSHYLTQYPLCVIESCTLHSTFCVWFSPAPCIVHFVIVQANHLPYIIPFVIESPTSYSILCVWLSRYLTQYALYAIESCTLYSTLWLSERTICFTQYPLWLSHLHRIVSFVCVIESLPYTMPFVCDWATEPSALHNTPCDWVLYLV